jgi:hypothetical protein
MRNTAVINTTYILRNDGGYVTEVFGPRGMSDEAVKRKITDNVTMVIISKAEHELPDAFRARIWGCSVTAHPRPGYVH